MGSQSDLRQRLTVADSAREREIAPVSLVQQMLVSRKHQIRQILPKVVTPERLMHITMNAVRDNPRLLECTEASLLGGVIQCAMLGLEPNTVLQQAFLIPFWHNGKRAYEAQFIAGYRGLLELARRSGKITKCQANVVREGDKFMYEFGFEETLRHVPAERYNPDAPITHAYAYARLAGGDVQFSVMPYGEIMAIRNQSSGFQAAAKRIQKINDKRAARGEDPLPPDTPWIKHEAAMCAKTAVRNLYKLLPCSVEMAKAEVLDSMADRGATQSLDAILEGEGFVTSIDSGESLGIDGSEDDSPEGATEDAAPAEDKKAAPDPKRKKTQSRKERRIDAPAWDAAQEEMLERIGFVQLELENGRAFVNEAGVVFDPKVHESQDDGTPTINSDGEFVAKSEG